MARTRITSKPRQQSSARRGSGGGPAASGGFNFQAAITAIAGAHALTGAPLGWLDGVIFDAPVALAAETGSGGDDLRLTFVGGDIADVQVKKGLRAGKDLKESINALVDAIAAGTIHYGVLVVDPDSSWSIREGLARDLRRLAEAPTVVVETFAEALRSRLVARDLDVQTTCGRLRIVTVPALPGNDAAVRTAIAHLGFVCRHHGDAPSAWDRLYRDAHLTMSQRAVRTIPGLAGVLRSANIALSDDPAHGPAALLTRLCDWTLTTTAEFSILGIAKPLQIDNAWIPLKAVVREPAATPPLTLAAALVDYHEPPSKNREDCEFDATTLGRFRRLAMVIGGPGSGKTILLKRLARAYAQDGQPVLRVSAKAVAQRMASRGEGFLTAAFELGLEGPGLSPVAMRVASLGNWVLLCDGLDECGAQQQEIAEGLLQAAVGEPAIRIVATTRSIGYRPATLSAWRHYDLAMGNVRDTVQQVTLLLGRILPIEAQDHLHQRVEEALEESDAGKAAARSPLLLGLCAALFASGLTPGRTRPQFYRAIFRLIEAEPPPRAPSPPATPVVRGRLLDVLGWTLIQNPHILARDAVGACAKVLKLELDIPLLKAHDLAERCLAWWQALGLVEQLHYGDEPVLTFVHKTFGEFAAGRYLSELPAVDQKRILEAETDTSALSEMIGFASALGAAPVFLDDLARRGFDGPQGQGRLLQALDIIGDARPSLNDGQIDPIVAVAVARMASAHRTWALQTASVLVDVAPSVAAQIAPRLPPLCTSEQLWTRLSAWALRVFVEGQRLDLDGLAQILQGFSGADTREALSTLEGAIIAGRHSGHDLSHRMALKIAERMLEERPANESRAWIEKIREFIWRGSYGFFLSLRDLARRYGLDLPYPTLTTRMEGLAEIGGADARHRAAITVLLESVSGGGVWQGPSGRPLYQLAAFFQLIRLREQTLPEIWVWRHPFDRPAITAVFRAFATLANIPLDALANDAATLLHEMAEAAKTSDETFRLLFAQTPAVDIEEVRLKRDTSLDIDFPTIERALTHPSSAAVVPALNVALAAGTWDDWRGAAIRLLADGQGNTLWAAAELAKRLPRGEGVVLLLNHMASPTRPGTTYVIDALKDLGVDDHPMREKALRSALFGTRVEAAIGAAAWLKAVPNSNADEGPLVQAAFDYWLIHEGPYPTKGGTVPPSPRADLTNALYGLRALDLSALRRLTEDSRPDVADAARAGIIDYIVKDAAARTQFVDAAQAGEIAPATLRKVLEKPEVFALNETRQLLTLLDSGNARTRLTAMAILDWPSVDTETRETSLGRLQMDPVPDIREQAIRMSG